MNPWLAVAALASAFAVGGALGAYWQDMEGDNDLLTEQNRSLTDQIAAADAARKDEREQNEKRVAALAAPPAARVYCTSAPATSAADLRPGGPTVGVPDGPPAEDATAAMRDLVVTAALNLGWDVSGVQAGEEKPR